MRDSIHSIDNILCRRHTVITVKAGHAVINGDRSCLHVVFYIAVGSYGRSGQITVLEIQSGTQAYRFSRAAVRFVGQVRRLSGFCAVKGHLIVHRMASRCCRNGYGIIRVGSVRADCNGTDCRILYGRLFHLNLNTRSIGSRFRKLTVTVNVKRTVLQS